MGFTSPDQYRASSGYRRSEAHSPLRVVAQGPTDSQSFTGLDDPNLASFLGQGRMSAAGLAINEQVALRNSTAHRAMALISGAMGMLPIHLMRRLAGGDTAEATDHSLFSVLKIKPNGYQTPFEFKSFMQYAALADGQAYARIARGVGDKVVALIPFKRGSVQPILTNTGELTFRINGQQILQAKDVFHFRTPLSLDGINGVSLITMAAESIGIAQQAERAAARLFRDGTLVGGVLKHSGALSDAAYDRLKRNMEERYSGAENAGKTMILEEGMELDTAGDDVKDLQFLETRQREAEEISRFSGVPRPLLMFDETSWGSGIEQLGQMFVTYCLLMWFVSWEEAIARSCLSDREVGTGVGTLYAKFNDGALLRGSLKDQADFLAKALGAGGSQAFFTPNEARANFDMNKIAGGDELPPRMASKGGSEPQPKDPANG